jgi:hypothetical protein
MTFCSTYIGDLEDPAFKWDGGDWNGNIPSGIGPIFPPEPEPYNGRSLPLLGCKSACFL